MPWQRDAVDVAGEYNPETGLPFYREIDLVVMRQQGKTTIELGATIDRFVSSWPGLQRGVYSAQTGNDARKKLLDDWTPILQGSVLAPLAFEPVRANGHERLRWRTGEFLESMASLEASGHGSTRQFAFIDEAWKDQDERREQAIRPALLTVPEAQLYVVSTAGNAGSVYLRRKVEQGREAATEDRGSGVCYIEYSVPDDEDPFDLDVMLRYMPALCPTPGPCECSGEWRHTVTQEVLTADMQGMDPDEACRAYGNRWLEGSGETVIPRELWQARLRADATPSPPFRLGLDVLREPGDDGRQSSALVACGGRVCEITSTEQDGERVFDHRPGTGWVVPRVKKIAAELGDVTVAVAGNGPAASVADDLEAEDVTVERMPSGEVVAACGGMYDAIADGTVTFVPHPAFEAAFRGLAKAPSGDRFVWSRSTSSEDITPLFAATLALVPRDDAVPLVAWA